MKLSQLFLGAMILVNCLSLSLAEGPRSPIQGSAHETQAEVDALGRQNTQSLKAQYEEEWRYNACSPQNDRPNLGLALSGGGMRSGIFCIGVMQGLQQIGVLEKVDAISSVSGGGYAASWLYFQGRQNNFDLPALFDNNRKYQRYLVNHGELVSHAAAQRNLLRWTGYGVNAVEVIASQPVNAFINGLFGWHANVSPLRPVYEKGIDRVYHVVPEESGARSALDFPGFMDLSCGLNSPKTLRFETFETFIHGKLPFPIVNTTSHIEDASVVDATLLKNRVFEFTPLHYGNDYFGYWKDNFPFSYNRLIAVSGAAVDSATVREPNKAMLFSAVNINLGYNINNPTNQGFAFWLRRLLPLPIYLFTGYYQKDVNGDRICLADGGHSENLGAYSLVRRVCNHIIIVDAEYDPDFEFGAYRSLKQALSAELHVNFEVAAIDDALKKGYFAGDTPVMFGDISYFPLYDPTTQTTKYVQLKVVYIKLSLDPNKIDAKHGYNAAITNFRKQHGDFPQQNTTDQTYTPDQVAAYRDLGNFIVNENKKDIKKFLRMP